MESGPTSYGIPTPCEIIYNICVFEFKLTLYLMSGLAHTYILHLGYKMFEIRLTFALQFKIFHPHHFGLKFFKLRRLS